MTARPETAFVPGDPIQQYNPEEPYVPWTDALMAAYRTENSLGSYLSQERVRLNVNTPEDWEPLNEMDGYEMYALQIMDFTDRNQLNRFKAQVDRERRDRLTLDNAGWKGVVSMMAAGALDPITLPFLYAPIAGGLIKSGQVARGIVLEAGMAVAATAPQEAILYETQATRTPIESALNIGASAFIGGVVGGAVGRWGDLPAIERSLNADFGDQPRYFRPDGDFTPLEAVATSVADRVLNLSGQLTGRLTKAAKRTINATRKTLGQQRAELWAKLNQLETIQAAREQVMAAGRTFKRAVPPRVMERKIWKDIARAELGPDATAEQVSSRATDIRKLWRDADLIPTMRGELRKMDEQLEDLNGQLAMDRRAVQAEKELSKIESMRKSGKSDGEILYELDGDVPRVKLDDIVNPEQPLSMDANGNVSAAKAYDRPEYEPLADDDTIMVGASAINWLAKISPVGRAIQAKSARARALMLNMAENAFRFAGLERGVAPPAAVESILKKYNAARLRATKHAKQLWGDYRKRVKASGETAMTIGEFLEAVGKAMRRGDESEIAEVTAAAQIYRSNVFDPLKKELDKLDLLPEGEAFKTADSYLTRIYNRDVLRSRAQEFDEIIAKWLRQVQSTKKEPIPMEEAMEIARDIRGSILGYHHGQMDWTNDAVAKGSPMHKRTLLIPDEMIEDFLVHNVDQIAADYTRSVAPRVELTRRFGDYNLVDELAEIAKEYDKLIRDNPAAEAALTRERKAVQKSLVAVRDRLLGTYGVPKDPAHWLVRASRVTRALNLLNMLGGMTVSATPDMARPVLIGGFMHYARGLANIGRAMSGLNMEQLQKMGTALDMMGSSRVAAMADLDDIVGHTKFEALMQEGTKGFARWSAMAPWNTFWKGFSGMLAQDEILRSARRVADGVQKAGDLKRLNAVGIDLDTARKIGKEQIDTDGSMWLANWDQWGDEIAKEQYQAAIVKIVDSTIVTPGAGDMLILFDDILSPEMSKVVLQFKTFAATAQNRMLVAGAQQNDMNFYSSMLLGVTFGALAYSAKQLLAGRELPDEESKFLVEAVDHSGYLGLLMEANNIAERATGGAVGVNPLMGMLTGQEYEMMSRYAAKAGVGALAGPTFGSTIPNVFGAIRGVTGAVTGEDVYSSDVRAFRKLIPYQNLFYARWLFDHMEEQAADILNARY